MKKRLIPMKILRVQSFSIDLLCPYCKITMDEKTITKDTISKYILCPRCLCKSRILFRAKADSYVRIRALGDMRILRDKTNKLWYIYDTSEQYARENYKRSKPSKKHLAYLREQHEQHKTQPCKNSLPKNN